MKAFTVLENFDLYQNESSLESLRKTIEKQELLFNQPSFDTNLYKFF